MQSRLAAQVNFPLSISDQVRIKISGEEGIVRALAHYHDDTQQALVLYKAADGRAVTEWWEVSLLEPVA